MEDRPTDVTPIKTRKPRSDRGVPHAKLTPGQLRALADEREKTLAQRERERCVKELEKAQKHIERAIEHAGDKADELREWALAAPVVLP